MRSLNRPKPEVTVERRGNGTLILSSPRALPENLPLTIDLLGRAAERRPDVTWLAERRGPGNGIDRAWQRLTYAEAWAKTGAVASWLIAQGYGPASKPLAILSDNSLENALFLFRRTLRAGALVAPVSPNYSIAGDFTRLDHVLSIVEPSLVFAQDSTKICGAALDRAAKRAAPASSRWTARRGLPFRRAHRQLDRCRRRRTSHAPRPPTRRPRSLFTSGSTGQPEGRAQHARQSHLGRRDDPHDGRAARRSAHRRHARLAAMASHTPGAATTNLGSIDAHRRLDVHRRRPADPGPLSRRRWKEISASSRRPASATCRWPIRSCWRRWSATPTCAPNSSRTCAALADGGALLPQEGGFDRLRGTATAQLGASACRSAAAGA